MGELVGGREGVWVIYMYDDSIIAQHICADSRDIIKAFRDYAGSRIGFWPIGTSLEDAISWWEGNDHDGKIPRG